MNVFEEFVEKIKANYFKNCRKMLWEQIQKKSTQIVNKLIVLLNEKEILMKILGNLA